MRRFNSLALLSVLAGQVAWAAGRLDKATAQNDWSVQVMAAASYSPYSAINSNYSATATDLQNNFNFNNPGIANQYLAWGLQLDFLYQYRIPYTLGLGLAFNLDVPGGLRLKREGKEEYLDISYSLANYLVKIKVGQEFFRGKTFFIRGFLEPAAGLGSLSKIEKVSGADFGTTRANNTRLTGFTWGASVTLDVLWRFTIRSGAFFGLRGGFLSYNSFRGTDAVGNPVILVSVPLTSNTSEEVFKFLKDGQDITGDQQTVSLLVPELGCYLGYWHAL